MTSFDTRIDTLERLDTGDYTAEEYSRWLAEMRFIHGVFGERRALKKTLLREIAASGKTDVSILDVGAGSGDLLARVAKRITGRSVFSVGAELGAEATRSIRSNGAAAVQCDGRQLPFANASFDHAFSTLFLHHLDDGDAIKVLREMSRVSRGRIFVVDLNRNRAAYRLYKLFGPIFFQRFTVEDGALSILRSRTPDELRSLAHEAGLRDVEITHSRLNRLVLSGVSE